MRTVLIVEDDPAMLRGLEDNFKMKGYYVLTAVDGEQALETALKEKPDLILLDIMLPEMNGYEVCSHVREKGLDMPIIMLTAKDQESDIVLGLNLGADDYVTKPFSIKELMARAEAFMRRRKESEPMVYEFGDCHVDISVHTLRRGGQEVTLTPGEFKMLHLFLRKSGCPLTQDEIRSTVWGRWADKYTEEKQSVLMLEFKRFRQAFLELPCQIVQTGRRMVYRLLSWNRWLPVFFRGLRALRHGPG